jgi:hypothetical protein
MSYLRSQTVVKTSAAPDAWRYWMKTGRAFFLSNGVVRMKSFPVADFTTFLTFF